METWKGGCRLILWGLYKNQWTFHAEHTMTGLEEMSGGYGWKKD